jgi:plasmid stabilization system protein ParE
MTYRVLYAPSFRASIAAQVDYLREEQVPEDIIESWFDRLFVSLDALREWPRRYPIDERMSEALGFEVRKLVHARYVITYHVDDAGRIVELLAIVHGARRK